MSENETPAVALVTGGNKGIGYEIVRQLAGRGLTVVLAARDRELGEAAAGKLGGEVHPVALDVTRPDTVHAAARWLDGRFGRLDVLVNNAGISGFGGRAYTPETGLPSVLDVDVVRTVFETNYFGVITVTNAMLPLLRRSAAPRIVNVSSGVGSLTLWSRPDSPITASPLSSGYAPSKTALNALTVQYARELRDAGVLVNAADPGYCATDLNGHRGYRTPAQGAAVAVHLATLPGDGPTGGFFGDDGTPVPW